MQYIDELQLRICFNTMNLNVIYNFKWVYFLILVNILPRVEMFFKETMLGKHELTTARTK